MDRPAEQHSVGSRIEGVAGRGPRRRSFTEAQRLYIVAAYNLRRQLTNKALSAQLKIPMWAVDKAIDSGRAK